MAEWEENEGLGFAFMYDDNQSTPYIGISMFEESGKHLNNSLTFNAGSRIDRGWEEQVFSEAMRSGVIEKEATTPDNYSILISSGPFSIGRGDSISPFIIAFVVGDNLNDLKTAVNKAYQRSNLVTTVHESGPTDGESWSLNNHPNPFFHSI